MNEENKKLVDVCIECLTADTIGGGQEVSQDASGMFSSDNYAPGDSRVPTSIFGGVLTRHGFTDQKKKLRKFVVRKNSK